MSINARCATCRFSRGVIDARIIPLIDELTSRRITDLECYRYPPTGTPVYVTRENWCGEYQPDVTPPVNPKLEP